MALGKKLIALSAGAALFVFALALFLTWIGA